MNSEMMLFVKSALETEDPEKMLMAIRTVAVARDNREIVIREFARSLPED